MKILGKGRSMKLHRAYANLEDANATAWELMEAGIGGGRTRVIQGARPVVEVEPAFGTARTAIAILEKRRAGDLAPAEIVELADTTGGSGGSDEAAPFSRALGLPVLTDGGFLSTHFGWKLLSKSPTPFSDLFGWKVLLNERPRQTPKDSEVNVSGL
jgi:hypothetical protein